MADELITTARKRFSLAKSAWSEIREQYNRDAEAVNVRGGQWHPAVKSARESENRPALEFNELNTYVQQITNKARQERPQPKIIAGDGGNPDTAEMLESKLRHIQDVSQADVAYDNAVEPAATGGYGFYRITTEYVDDSSFHQEPRVKRILDPQTVYVDPDAQEPDFSDAQWWFIRKRMSREDFKTEFRVEPVPFDHDADPDWGDKEDVWVAEYWHVERTKRQLLQLADGRIVFDDDPDVTEEDRNGARASRPVIERTIHWDIIDGEKVLEENEWLGKWVPIIPVLGREVIVKGKRHLISAVRFALDAQQLKNAGLSSMAEMIGTANDSPYIGYKGSFKSPDWRSQKRVRYLEVEPVTINNTVAPLPQRNTYEPPIQALTSFSVQMTDNIKRSVGYIDNVLRPSQGDISGVAVLRREQQQDLTNYHFEDNLIRSQWHAGRVMLDLILNLVDTPRAMHVMKPDGSTDVVPVTMQMEDGTVPEVPGYEGKPHHRIDIGQYNVTISTGPAYATKIEEEADALDAMFQRNPALMQIAGDLYAKLRGWPELEQRLKLALPPAVQQAISSQARGVPPVFQAQLAQLMAQNNALKQGLQQVLMKLQTKQVEQEGRLHVERLKTAGQVVVEEMKQRHDATKEMASDRMEAVQMLLQMLHESELAPTPGPGWGNNAEPMAAQPGAAGGPTSLQ